jgi:hypothetical protein
VARPGAAALFQVLRNTAISQGHAYTLTLS